MCVQVMFYSKSIYQTAGVPQHSLQYAVLLTAALNFLMTIVAVSTLLVTSTYLLFNSANIWLVGLYYCDDQSGLVFQLAASI